MRDFRIHAHHFRMIQRRDEAQIMAGGGHVDIGARLIGLGFQSEFHAIFAIDDCIRKDN